MNRTQEILQDGKYDFADAVSHICLFEGKTCQTEKYTKTTVQHQVNVLLVDWFSF